MKYIPLPRGAYERECYNLADLFANNFTNISNPTEPHPGVPNSGSAIANDPNRLNVTALNRAAFDIRANTPASGISRSTKACTVRRRLERLPRDC